MPKTKQKTVTNKPNRTRTSSRSLTTQKPKFAMTSVLLVAGLLATLGIAFVLLSQAGTKPYSRLDCNATNRYMSASGSTSEEKKQQCLLLSAEGKSAQLYRVLFGRDIASDPASFKKWANYYVGLRKDHSTEFVKKLLTTPTARQGYLKLSDTDKVAALYQNTLDRQPDQSGKDFWLKYLKRNRSPKTIAAFANTREAKTKLKSSVLEGLNALPASYRPQASLCGNGLNEQECRAFVAAVRRNQGEPCKQYSLGGNVTPLCKASSSGTIKDVLVERNIDGSNVTLNKAAAAKFQAMRRAAKQEAGITLGANDELGGGYGSYRTQAMQEELVNRGYPAAPVGKSMHQWGLAIDFACNGKMFNQSGATCQNWIRTNVGRFGFYNLPSEAWHYSTNGK